ncbi:UDP-N-acetylmuramoyl-tripeptide--D-alanyl-D-alanine ligase [Cellvibrio mixtus]|uniref:UDP-N-acetylmuramoyl-tripeptide--D-alanyl-D- alanine ligase n=1 Tax=Cellvibrio mixtus TaxID=39650 RepID=UPI0005875229|nr:UDP-N-acetylmuramoyl-tripeptide--D-alanyl-D-alanine ligase [Cellvibrio mixtus]
MIKPLSLKRIEEFIKAQSLQRPVSVQCYGDAEFTAVNSDTRNLNAGELFVAIRGEFFDPHQFIEQAVAKKPCALVVEKYFPDIALPQLVVSDSILALGQIAALNRSLFTGKLIGITGSSGKTTVKTMVASILAECGDTHATKGNLNNHIGVPFTLLQLTAANEFAVIEMGASGPGEIGYLCSLAKPQVTMINNVMPAHIEGFGSIEGVAKAKGEIYESLVAGATAVVNLDDQFSSSWLAQLRNRTVISVSLHNSDANFHARAIELSDAEVSFELVADTKATSITLNAQGEHSVRNALMAAACAFAAGASLQQIQTGLANFAPVSGRMSKHVGVNQVHIIDDSYNANPGSVRAAIDVLAQKTRGVLVLGDLAELGSDSAQLHGELGDYARSKKLPHIFTLGNLSQNASQHFGEGAQHFTDRASLVAHLKTIARADMTLLIKGSRSSKMDLVVRELCDSAGDTH